MLCCTGNESVTPPADFDENYLQKIVGLGGEYFQTTVLYFCRTPTKPIAIGLKIEGINGCEDVSCDVRRFLEKDRQHSAFGELYGQALEQECRFPVALLAFVRFPVNVRK